MLRSRMPAHAKPFVSSSNPEPPRFRSAVRLAGSDVNTACCNVLQNLGVFFPNGQTRTVAVAVAEPTAKNVGINRQIDRMETQRSAYIDPMVPFNLAILPG